MLVTTPPHELSPVGQLRNNSNMSVTSDTSHSGISTQPALPHRAELGSAQFVSVEQHASPLGTAERHALTASLRPWLVTDRRRCRRRRPGRRRRRSGEHAAARHAPPGLHSLVPRHGLWTHALDGPLTEPVLSLRRAI